MRLDQVVVAASPGDAITGMAMRLRDEFARAIDSDVFALHVHPSLVDDVRPFEEITRLAACGPVVYHMSIGCDEIVRWLRRTSRPVVLDYHNITPSQYFNAIDPVFAALLAQGRKELRDLAPVVQRAIAVSTYNAQELLEAGYRDVQVATPVLSTERLLDLQPAWLMQNHLEQMVHGPVILAVGQLLPHKRVDRLIEAYHILVSHHLPDAKLIIVGAARNDAYARALTHQVRQLNLPGAWLTGSVSDEELVALFRRADVFATMSEHEGFCFPVVEAFAFGVPVLARRFAALPDTVGNGGLLLAPDDGVAVAAEAMLELIQNQGLRTRLIQRGLERADAFAPRRALRRHLELLAEVA